MSYSIVGLNGQNAERFETRERATLRCAQLNSTEDYVKQDAEDSAFCAKYGVPFQPRRYFVTHEKRCETPA